MTGREPWFVNERAERQAALLWTELPVSVFPLEGHDPKVDLRIVDSREPAHPLELGIEVVGALGLSRILTASLRLRPSFRRHLSSRLASYRMPIAIMVVQVRTLETYFGWMVVPNPETGRFLVAADRPLRRANREVLEQALDQLKQWSKRNGSA